MTPDPPLCLHCQAEPRETYLGLCLACHGLPAIHIMYAPPAQEHGKRRPLPWPEWAEHLERLAAKVKQRLPL